MSQPPKRLNPRDLKFLVPSARTAHYSLATVALLGTCWLFLAYGQSSTLMELAKIVVYGCGGIGVKWLVAELRGGPPRS